MLKTCGRSSKGSASWDTENALVRHLLMQEGMSGLKYTTGHDVVMHSFPVLFITQWTAGIAAYLKTELSALWFNVRNYVDSFMRWLPEAWRLFTIVIHVVSTLSAWREVSSLSLSSSNYFSLLCHRISFCSLTHPSDHDPAHLYRKIHL